MSSEIVASPSGSFPPGGGPSLTIPPYVSRSGFVEAPITHAWDDADPEPAYLFMDERLQHRIGKTSDRGVLALSAGFAEWVAWRMSGFSDDPSLLLKIEATWAAIVDWRYLKLWERASSRNWQGPVRGPMWGASDMLRRVIDLTKREQFAFPESVCLSYLVLHIAPDPKPFKEWRRSALGRLSTFYPRDMQNVLGAVLPRQVLDPDFPYKPEKAAEMVAAFIEGLNPLRNPYLRPASEMLDLGFQGTPYSTRG